MAIVDPPPIRPGDDRRGRVGRWIAAYVIVAVLVGMVAVIEPQWSPRPTRSCQNNLQQLAGLYTEMSAGTTGGPPRSGQALLLGWRKDGVRIRRGQESVLICPRDQGICVPDTREATDRYDTVALDAPPDDLCSYAVRDFERFPLDPARLEVIAACVGRFHDGTWSACHKGGIVVAYCDGSSRFVEWPELSLGEEGSSPDEPPVVGPESPTPLLRVLCFRPGVTTRASR